MRILITGALGHIGSKLICRWKEDEIFLLDNLHTQRYSSLFNLPSKHSFVERDIFAPGLQRLVNQVDVVIHLAALTNAEESVENPDFYHHVNCGGAERVAQACSIAGVPLIFPSTTSVYGVQDGLVDESHEALQPQSPYAVAKLAAETALTQFPYLKFIILRLGTIYGPSMGMRFHTAVNRFVWQARWGEEITVWNKAANQLRPYLSLDDCVDLFKFIIEQELYDRQVYNAVTLNSTPHEIVDIINDFIKRVRVAYVDHPLVNQLSYEISSQKIKDKGFEFKGDLRQGIRETIEWLGKS